MVLKFQHDLKKGNNMIRKVMLHGMTISGAEFNRRRSGKRLLEHNKDLYILVASTKLKAIKVERSKRIQDTCWKYSQDQLNSVIWVINNKLLTMKHTKVSNLFARGCGGVHLASLSLLLLGPSSSYLVQIVPLVLASSTYLAHTFIDPASPMHSAS